MNANQGGLGRVDRTLHEGEMVSLVHRRTIEVQLEIAIICRQRDSLLTLDEFFPLAAVGNQILNAADLKPMLLLES